MKKRRKTEPMKRISTTSARADDEEIDLGLAVPKGGDLDEELGDEEEGESDEGEADDEDEDEEPVRKGRGKQGSSRKARQSSRSKG